MSTHYLSLCISHTLLVVVPRCVAVCMHTCVVMVMYDFQVRRENVRLNTAKRTFAFNALQRQFLPHEYRPPAGSARGGKG